jgi:CheY-like chemotaxis protein
MTTIALVENDRKILAEVSKALKAEGYQTVTYTDGASALNDFHVSPPDLVVLDIAIPRMSELVLRALRMSEMPVLILTSKNQKVKFSRKMPYDFIAKPISRSVLLERIKALLQNASLIEGGVAWVPKRDPKDVQPNLEEFTPSESLVELFHEGVLADYEILRASTPEAAREISSLAYARAILPGRILEVIASRALRMQLGVLKRKPLSVGGVFDQDFVQELSEHVSLRMGKRPEFFSRLHDDLVAYLNQGGSIAGRWGRLVLTNNNISIATKDSIKLAPTDDGFPLLS